MYYYPDDKFHGLIKTVRETYETSSTRNSVTNRGQTFTVKTYNRFGSQTKIRKTDAQENVIFEQYFEYDEANRLTARKSFNIQDKLNVEEFYAKGLPTEKIMYNTDGSVRFNIAYLHDSQKRLVYSASRRPDGTLSDRNEILYDSSGGRTEDELFDEFVRKSDLTTRVKTAHGFDVNISVVGGSRQKTIYNAIGNPTSAEFYDGHNAPIKRYEFLYDAQEGRLAEVHEYLISLDNQSLLIDVPAPFTNVVYSFISIASYAQEGDFNQSLKSLTGDQIDTRITYKWDEEGHLAETRHFVLGRFIAKTEYAYGADGKLRHKSDQGADGSIHSEISLEWKFDRQQNWIEMTSLETLHRSGGSAWLVNRKISRDIEYYE